MDMKREVNLRVRGDIGRFFNERSRKGRGPATTEKKGSSSTWGSLPVREGR